VTLAKARQQYRLAERRACQTADKGRSAFFRHARACPEHLQTFDFIGS
jgi:hypothetical protein